MCLNVKVSNGIEPETKTAPYEIRVYKGIRGSNVSFHQGFRYQAHTLYRHRQALKSCDSYANPFAPNSKSRFFQYIKGFHSFSKETSCMCNFFNPYAHIDMKVVEFFIPKGAKYLLGMNGEVISSSIRSGDLKPLSSEDIIPVNWQKL